MATSNPPKPSNLLKIIWEALVFLTNNWKPALIYIFFYSIFFYSTFFLLSFFQSSATTPIITNLIFLSKLKPQDPDFYQTLTVILTEIREITTAIETIFYVAIFFLSNLLLASTLCFICMAYVDKKPPELKELLSRFRRTWKGALFTQFYVTIDMSAFIGLFLVCGIAIFSVNFAGVAVSFVLLILGVILYLFLAMIWLLSVVVSVEEEEGGIFGPDAMVKAADMMKGRRWKGSLIAFLLILLNLVVFLPPLMHLSSFESKKMVILGIFSVVGALVKLFELAVVVVFYFECRNGRGWKMNKFGAEYSKLASEVTNSEIP